MLEVCEDVVDENIERSYEQLQKVIIAKNDIINEAASCVQSLNENEEKMQTLEQNLRKLRSEIVFNPIQDKINKAFQENVIQQRKSAEHIYSALQKEYLGITECEAHELKLKDELRQFDELIKSVENSLNSIERRKTKERESLLKKIEDVNEQNRNLIILNNELKISIQHKNEYLSDDETNLQLLENQIKNKETILQMSSETHSKNMETLSNLASLQANISAPLDEHLVDFKEFEDLLTHEIAELRSKANDYDEKVKDIKENLIIHRQFNEEYKDKIMALKNKKVLLDTVQIQRKKNDQAEEDLKLLRETIANHEKLLTDTKLELKHRKDKENDIKNELIRLKKMNEDLAQEKNNHHEKMKLKQEDIQKIKIELDIIRKANKDKDETINTLSFAEESLTVERKEAEDNLTKITAQINIVNENISQLQINIENTEKLPTSIQLLEIEEQNKQIDLKTVKYLKAAENCKRRKAAEKAEALQKARALQIARRTSYYKHESDSSQDSMLLPKKKRTV